MSIWSWSNLWQGLGVVSGPTKRTGRDGRRWEFASEHLESRALLSASSIAPESAEVVNGAKAFSFPNVGGTWTVDLGELGESTLTLTQNGAKVTASMNAPLIGQITTNGKFTKKHNHELNGKVKVETPLGKVTVQINVEFPEEAQPQTFTGEIRGTGKQLDEPLELQVTGTRNPIQTASLSSAAKETIQFPSVGGRWLLVANGENVDINRGMLIAQSGPGGVKIRTSADTNTGLRASRISFEKSIKLKGKFDDSNTLHVSGKGSLSTDPSTTYKGTFEITFNEALDSFTGVLHSKTNGDITMTGDRNIPM